MNKKIQELEREYQLMFELYGVQSRMWSMLYENYSNAVFCPENRKDIIQQYLAWEDFTIRGQFIDEYGRRITILGQFAFSYTIEISSPFSTIIERYDNGRKARTRFQQLKLKRQNKGHFSHQWDLPFSFPQLFSTII